ncbi:hypothetical protein EZV61_09090 [Corallincola luteus]|uniref:Uncharacterized protein n=1 Tax=Corallincola luteus TaxID=1775177 RepID=A0ABY2ALB8_9GAMM|nr:hypothetical protein [Corallincola luteus]TCI03689.1 hypothetical protein EZV61_09090 [Corallincola luteus]
MKIPSLEQTKEEKDFSWFETQQDRFAFTARKKNGCNESHYVVDSAAFVSTSEPHLEYNHDRPCALGVTGEVVETWEDGVFVVSANGFDFWVEPDDIDGEASIGQFYSLKISDFTVYV